MKIQFNQILKDLDGENMQEATPKGNKDLTLKSACVNALFVELQDERTSGKDKLERYALALKIHNSNDEVELKVEEFALLKNRVGKLYLPLIVGRVYEIIEGKKDE